MFSVKCFPSSVLRQLFSVQCFPSGVFRQVFSVKYFLSNVRHFLDGGVFRSIGNLSYSPGKASWAARGNIGSKSVIGEQMDVAGMDVP